MPEVVSSVSLPWRDAGTVAASAGLPWRDATLITSTGGMFYLPDAPPGGTPTRRGLEPRFRLPAGPYFDAVHTLTVTDAETGDPVTIEDVSISCDDGSVCWTLSASGPHQIFTAALAATPPVWTVDIDGMTWNFLIESGSRQRGEFGRGAVSVGGRSITMLAAEPNAAAQTWLNEGPVSAAQVVDQAFADTGATMRWHLDDWLIPDRGWSFTGAPVEVARRVADAVGADVRSDRAEPIITIEPRYRHLPQDWHLQPPDVEISSDVVLGDTYERADRPEWSEVYVAGQQQGVLAHVRKATGDGGLQGPYTTDSLITDAEAARQRGMAILASGGPQARVTLTLPVLTGDGRPGVLEPGYLCRVVERGEPAWWGVVRSVRLSVSGATAEQVVGIERHIVETPTTDPDVFTLRSETAEIQYMDKYRERFPSLEGFGVTIDYGGGGILHPEFGGVLSEDKRSVSFSNPQPVIPRGNESGVGYLRFVTSFKQPYFPAYPTHPVFEWVFKASGGRRHACVGIIGPAGYVPLLHEVGVTDPLNVFGLRRRTPGIVPGDVIGIVPVLIPYDGIRQQRTFLVVYLNGRPVLDVGGQAVEVQDRFWWLHRTGHFFCGQQSPRDYPREFGGGR